MSEQPKVELFNVFARRRGESRIKRVRENLTFDEATAAVRAMEAADYVEGAVIAADVGGL